eukprot:2036-Heterococcus_DN1.PRE.2
MKDSAGGTKHDSNTGSDSNTQELAIADENNTVTYMEAFTAMQNAEWLSREVNTLSTASCALVTESRRSINCVIAETISADTIRCIMAHSNIVKLDVKCAQLATPVLRALPNMFTQQLPLNSRLTSFTIDDLQQLDQRMVNLLFKSMPKTLHTLSIAQTAALRHDHLCYDAVTCSKSVKHLTLAYCGFYVVKPEGLQTLHMNYCDSMAYAHLPSTLLELHTIDAWLYLPPLPYGLQRLQMHSTSEWKKDVTIRDLPDTITHLKLPEYHRLCIEQWPAQLQVLDVGNHYPHDLNDLPDTVRELYARINHMVAPMHSITTLPRDLRVYDITTIQSRVQTLPERLEVLRIDSICGQFDQTIPAQLPVTLKDFKMSGYNYAELPPLPEGLEILDVRWAYHFQQKLDDNMLPVTLKALFVSEIYKHSLAHLRSSITVQRFGPRYSIIDTKIW